MSLNACEQALRTSRTRLVRPEMSIRGGRSIISRQKPNHFRKPSFLFSRSRSRTSQWKQSMNKTRNQTYEHRQPQYWSNQRCSWGQRGGSIHEGE